MDTIYKNYKLDKTNNIKDNNKTTNTDMIKSFMKYLESKKIKASYKILGDYGCYQEIKIVLDNHENNFKFLQILTKFCINVSPDSIKQPAGTYIIELLKNREKHWEYERYERY